MAYSPKPKNTTNVGDGVERRKSLYALCDGINCVSFYEKKSQGNSSNNSK